MATPPDLGSPGIGGVIPPPGGFVPPPPSGGVPPPKFTPPGMGGVMPPPGGFGPPGMGGVMPPPGGFGPPGGTPRPVHPPSPSPYPLQGGVRVSPEQERESQPPAPPPPLMTPPPPAPAAPVAPPPAVPAPSPFGPGPQLPAKTHQTNFMNLWKINSQAAFDYLSKSQSSIAWGQQNQNWIRDNLFNGDQYAMNQWKNDSAIHMQNMYAQADPGFAQYVTNLANGVATPGNPWDPSQGVTPWMSGAQFNPFATAPGGGGGGYAAGGAPGTQNTPFVPSFGYNPFDPGYYGTNNYDPTTGTYSNAAPMAIAPKPAPKTAVPSSAAAYALPGPNVSPNVTVPTVTNNNTPSTVNPLFTTPGSGGYRYRNPYIVTQ